MTLPSDISIVVPVGRGAPHFERCASSLQQLHPPPGEVVIVFDGPAPASESHLASARALGARLIQLDRKSGPAAARNRGAAIARGEVLFFLDSDVVVPTDLLTRLSGRLGRETGDVDTAAVIGSYDASPGASGFVSQYRNLLHHYVHQNGHDVASTFWSGCGAVLRTIFLEVGGFDEAYADPSIEDIELGSRLRQAGYRIRLEKSLQVKHLKRWTLKSMVHTDLFRRAIPWTEQMLGSGGLVNDLNVKTKERWSVVVAFLAPALFLVALLVPVRSSVAALGGLAALALFGLLNLGWFRFLRRARGFLFSLRSAPLQWLYYVICGLGFGIGFLRHLGRSSGQADP